MKISDEHLYHLYSLKEPPHGQEAQFSKRSRTSIQTGDKIVLVIEL